MSGAADSFLGRGWGFPPSFTANGREVLTVAEEEDIRQSLQILFATTPGERVMREDFGCGLQRFVFAAIDQTLVNDLTGSVTDALLYYEPRIRLNNVAVQESDDTPGLLLIAIDYTIRSTNSRYNMVYPFYLDEAVPADG